MSSTRIRSLSLFFGFVVLAIGMGATMQFTLRASAEESKDAKLKHLLNEKLAILQHVVEQVEQMHKQRVAGLKELYAAHLAMNRAKLDICTTDAERISVLEDLLAEAKRREATELSWSKASTRVVAEGDSSLTAEEAQIDRINVEIELERIKSK